MDAPAVATTTCNQRRKRWVFRVGVLVMAWLVCEVLAWMGLWLVGHGWRNESDSRDELAQHGGSPKSRRESDEILHPYLGWVRRPGSEFSRGDDAGDATAPHITQFGFADDGSPLTQREPGTKVIAILGGSLAEEFSQFAWPMLRELLQAAPEFRNHKLKIVRLALEGYKQPQQSLLLHYLLSLNAEFDVVINIDGFNEMALPFVENVPSRVFAAFPRNWNIRVMDTNDRALLRLIGHVVHLQERERRRARAFASAPWRWSPTATLVWRVLHRSNVNDEVQLQLDLVAAQRDRRLGDILGPPEQFASDVELYRHCATIWRNSSRLMHDLCQVRGIRYLHFLQPNQHLSGSKVLSLEERSLDRGQDPPWHRVVEQGYPLLIKAGAELRNSGVEFHDLSLLFQSESQTTYRDACCHLNNLGNAILAQRIAQAMLSAP